jgi:hypothetical protein
MCSVSMVGDFYSDKFRPYLTPNSPNVTYPHIPSPVVTFLPPVSREEFEALKREVQDMKELLKRAKAYDEQNNEPHCETEEKIALLRKVAAAVGVSLDDVLGAKSAP